MSEKEESAKLNPALTPSPRSEKEAKGIRFFLVAFAAWLYRQLASGWIGALFTSYDRVENRFNEGSISRFLSRSKRKNSFAAQVRRKTVFWLENSQSVHAVDRVGAGMLACSLSAYGLFLLIAGGIAVVTGILRDGLTGTSVVFSDRFLCGIVSVFGSFALLPSNGSLAERLSESRVAHTVLIDWIGIPAKAFRRGEENRKLSYFFAMAIGIAVGILSIFVEPLHLVLGMTAIGVLLLIVKYPEIGVVLTLFTLPFWILFSDGVTFGTVLMAVTVLGFWGKLLCGRRSLKYDFADFLIFLFGIAVFLGGVFAGGKEGMRTAALFALALLGSPILVNTARSVDWLERYLRAPLVSTSLLILAKMIAGVWQANALLPSLNETVLGRLTVALCGVDETLFSVFPILLFPLLLSHFFTSRKRVWKILILAVMALWVVGVALSAPTAALLPMTVGILITLLMWDSRTLAYLVLAILPMAGTAALLPEGARSALAAFGEECLAPLSAFVPSLLRVKDLFLAFAPSGVGFGEEYTQTVYAAYALPGTEGMAGVVNLPISLAVSLGGVGLLLFAAVRFFFWQKTFGFLRANPGNPYRAPVIACFGGTVGALVFGLSADLFADLRSFLLFWVLTAASSACIRMGNHHARERRYAEEATPANAEWQLNFD